MWRFPRDKQKNLCMRFKCELNQLQLKIPAFFRSFLTFRSSYSSVKDCVTYGRTVGLFSFLVFSTPARPSFTSQHRGRTEDGLEVGGQRRMASQVELYVMLPVTRLLSNNSWRLIGGGRSRGHVNHAVTNTHLECTF